jgi:hypothetical protein
MDNVRVNQMNRYSELAYRSDGVRLPKMDPLKKFNNGDIVNFIENTITMEDINESVDKKYDGT